MISSNLVFLLVVRVIRDSVIHIDCYGETSILIEDENQKGIRTIPFLAPITTSQALHLALSIHLETRSCWLLPFVHIMCLRA